MLKAYKYRIYPNKQQAELINKHFGCCRLIFNLTNKILFIILCYLLHISYVCGMKQYRLSDQQKIQLVSLFETGKYTCVDLSKQFGVSGVAIQGLLKRRGYKMKSQSELQRKYPIDETFFDKINTEEKAYFLGFLYADGYNNTTRNSIALSLKENDKEILLKLNLLLQPTKPLQYIKIKTPNCSNQYRLIIANKHISKKLSELGCVKAKTHILKFPYWINNDLLQHFIRGYFDGDGYLGICKNRGAFCIVSTKDFCESLKQIFLTKLNVTSHIRTRHPERNNNIRMLDISGNRQILTTLNWLYKNSKIHLKRKNNKYIKFIKFHNNLIKNCKNQYAALNIKIAGLNLLTGKGIPEEPVESPALAGAMKQECTTIR